MSATGPGMKIEALPVPRRPFVLWLPALGSLAGALFLLAGFLAVRSSLPGRIASHFDANGVANGWSSPVLFLSFGVVTIGILGAVFTGILYSLTRSAVLQYRFGSWLFVPFAAFGAILVGFSIPFSFVATLVFDAGRWPWGFASSIWVPLAADLALTIGLVAYAFTRLRRVVPDVGPLDPSEPALRGSGPIFLCSSCGRRFVRPAWVLVGPRVGISAAPGGATWYLRCPICGERGWQTRVGWNRPGASPGAPPGAGTH